MTQWRISTQNKLEWFRDVHNDDRGLVTSYVIQWVHGGRYQLNYATHDGPRHLIPLGDPQVSLKAAKVAADLHHYGEVRTA